MLDQDATRPRAAVPPQTRYQGSKLKLLPWLWSHLERIEFASSLDAFGGSGSVAYSMKACGKAVAYNDLLPSNFVMGLGLIENSSITIAASDAEDLMIRSPQIRYDDFIERHFEDVFFLDAENAWLDVVAQNILRIENPYQRAIAFYALFQACLVKRPYNLFHRRNLYMRTADVARTFGNKVTWDTPFDVHFRRFLNIANAAVFDSGAASTATCGDATAQPGTFDLVYVDPPYMNGRGQGTNYGDYYHFLDGLCRYDEWPELIDPRKRHLPLLAAPSPWLSKDTIHSAFTAIFERFADSVMVVSYRSDGIPSIDDIVRLLRRYKSNVSTYRLGAYQYALSTNRRSEEVLVVGQ